MLLTIPVGFDDMDSSIFVQRLFCPLQDRDDVAGASPHLVQEADDVGEDNRQDGGVVALTERIGRRQGLALGLGVGVPGAALAAGAVVAESLLLFLAGLALMGVASASIGLGRFAVAEVHPPERRGQAISNVVIAGAIGSVAGPLLVAPSPQWQTPWRWPWAGPQTPENALDA